MSIKKSVKGNKNKNNNTIEEIQIDYPIESCIILLYEAIDEKEILKKILHENNITVIDEIKMKFDKINAKKFIENDIETWNIINDLNSKMKETKSKNNKNTKNTKPTSNKSKKSKISSAKSKINENEINEEEIGPEKCIIKYFIINIIVFHLLYGELKV